jgi:hypothetical protein
MDHLNNASEQYVVKHDPAIDEAWKWGSMGCIRARSSLLVLLQAPGALVYTPTMVRPEARLSPKIPFASDGVVYACCVLPAGASPATVSAGAPCSRLRSWGEIPPAERSIESPHVPVGVRGGERSCGPRMKRTLQPRERGPRKGGTSRAGHFAVKATDCTWRSGGVQGVPGVGRRARSDGRARNRRDPTRRPTSPSG